MIQNLNEELFSFIKKSPTGFHAVHELANYLTEAGFERLAEEVPEPEAPAAAPEAQPDAKADPCDCPYAKKAAQAAKSVKARPAAEEAKAAEAEKAE